MGESSLAQMSGQYRRRCGLLAVAEEEWTEMVEKTAEETCGHRVFESRIQE